MIKKYDNDFYQYSVIINNQTNTPQNAEFQESRLDPLLSNMENFQLCVQRFSISSAAIPLFAFEDDAYTISFSIGDNNSNMLPPQIVQFDTSINGNVSTQFDSVKNKFVYYYTSFTTLVNRALELLYATALGDPNYAPILGPYAAKTAPYIDFKTPFHRFILPFDKTTANGSAFVKITGQPYINIHMSGKLYFFYCGFNSTQLSKTLPFPNCEYVMNILYPQCFLDVEESKQFSATRPDQEVLAWKQDYSCLNQWQQISKLVLTTTVPIENISIGLQALNGFNYKLNSFVDYEIQPDSLGSQRDYIYYFSENDRYINFTQNGDLVDFNLRIYFQDKRLNLYALTLLPGFSAEILFYFKRRKAVSMTRH